MELKSSIMGIFPSTYPFDVLPNLTLEGSPDIPYLNLICEEPIMQNADFKPSPLLSFHSSSVPFMFQAPVSLEEPQRQYPSLRPRKYGLQHAGGIDFEKEIMESYGVAIEERGKGNSAEKERRGQMSEKFSELRSLVPNPIKKDRASIIADATEYIKELLRTVEELSTLVQRKRSAEQKRKKQRLGDEVAFDAGSYSLKAQGGSNCIVGALRSSWLQRKSKETAVDVRIIEDEAFIKLTLRKKSHCLLVVVDILNELKLELFHLAFGNVGDYCTFMINTKIPECSTVHASSIAEKFIAVMSSQFQVLPYGC